MNERISHTEIDDLLSSIRNLLSENSDDETAKHNPTSNDHGSDNEKTQSKDNRLILSPQFRVKDPENPYNSIKRLTEETQVSTNDDRHAFKQNSDELKDKIINSPDNNDDKENNPTRQNNPEKMLNKQELSHEDITFTKTRLIEDVTQPSGKTPSNDTEETTGIASFKSIHRRLSEDQPETVTLGPEENDLNIISKENTQTRLETHESIYNKSSNFDRSYTNKTDDSTEVDVNTVDDDTPIDDTLQSINQGELVDFEDMAEPEVQGVLDEDHLREIITQVVREELSGHLGERITRNVRKLVRRELRQLMATDDFE